MQQEQDTCRICSGPGEPEQPLFYPCKCSGTIRYIHQDCLKTWLDHSKKSTCDVCKHPYAFTKVYAPDMPERVPMTILVRKFAEQVLAVILFMLRATLVAFVWLTLLPYGTVLTWRLYFRMGDVLAWWISLHPRPSSPISKLNATEDPTQNHTSPLNSSTLLHMSSGEFSLQPYLRNLSSDIFTGQIIASLIVLAFLAIFLLREWIQQNARPGVFDDGPIVEAQAQAEAQPQPQADPAPAEDRPDGEPAANVDAQWIPGAPEFPPALLPAARPVPDVPEDVQANEPTSSSSSESESSTPRPAAAVLEPPARPYGRRKLLEATRRGPRKIPTGMDQVEVHRRRRVTEGEDIGADTFDGRETPPQRMRREYAPLRRKSHSLNPSDFRRPRHGGIYTLESGPRGGGSDSELAERPKSDTLGQKRMTDEDEIEASESGTSHPQRSPLRSPTNFKFTFRSPPVSRDETFPPTFALPENGEFKFRPRSRSSSQPTTSSWSVVDMPRPAASSSSSPLFVPMPNVSRASSIRSSPVEPYSTLEDGELSPLPSEHSPTETSEALPSVTQPSSLREASMDFGVPFQAAFSTPPGGHTPRRPPLPASTVSVVDHVNAEASSSTGGNATSLALPSPSLATYRPPEDLQDDDGGYFGASASTPVHGDARQVEIEDEDDEDEEEEGRLDDYFREPDHGDARDMPPPLLPDTDDEEEDGHDAEERLRADENPPANAPLARDALNGELEGDLADDERDQNLEEDLDGAMEAVGLRGPVFAVFQNAALMLFILNVSIGGGVWIPFTLGKTTALLTLEPRRALEILHLPIRAVRLITDPSVDGIVYSIRWLSTALFVWSHLIFVGTLQIIGVAFGKTTQKGLLNFSQRINPRRLFTLLTSGSGKTVSGSTLEGLSWIRSSESILTYIQSFTHSEQSATSIIHSMTATPVFQSAEQNFAVLGRRIRLMSTAAFKGWVHLAEGDGTIERLCAILLGYIIVAFLAALYLNTITVNNVKSAGRAVRNAIKQQMIVLKVALFIIVELVMFPFGCGTMLDFSTLALFPEATVESRVSFFMYAPVTAAFYHWLIGTMFMYQFAILLATCREILRPGCMWFIKDPQDPTFHPIRDILDRPTFAQLRKLCMSAMMYAMVISLGVGSIVWGLTIIAPTVLPLRWKMREPLSEIPVDLLFVHLILPPTLHYFRPRKAVRRLMTAWWRWAARQLRLTSFMFGGRHPNEEYTPTQWSWRTLFSNSEHELVDMDTPRDGGFRRAPAGDNIAFLRDKPALVQVDEHGTALDEAGRALMGAQNAEAQQAGRNPQEDYTVVYVPPSFRQRIFLFIALFWISGSTAMVSAIILPILLGRAVFGLFASRQVHDGYSFIAGFYLLWWSWLLGILVVKVRIRRQRHEGSRRIRAGWLLFLFKRIFLYFTKIIWLALWLGAILPTLVSITADLYLIIPLRSFFQPNITPTIHVFESWATGLIIAKIIIRMQGGRPGTGLGAALEAIQRNGWRRPDPIAATRDFIIPVAAGFVGMIILPPVVLYGCSWVVVLPWKMEDMFRLMYPSIFVAVATFQFAMSLVGVFSKWTQGIRDKEFLVELRLRNLENPRKNSKLEASETQNGQELAEREED